MKILMENWKKFLKEQKLPKNARNILIAEPYNLDQQFSSIEELITHIKSLDRYRLETDLGVFDDPEVVSKISSSFKAKEAPAKVEPLAEPLAEAKYNKKCTQNISLNCVGENVKAIQTKLYTALAADPSSGLSGEIPQELQDGKFGPKTKEMVINFQQKHSLSVDGIVGPETLAKLDSVLKGEVEPPTPEKPKDVQPVKKVDPANIVGTVVLPRFLRNPMPDGSPSPSARFQQARAGGVSHGALDILAPMGTAIYAAGYGKVVTAWSTSRWMGYTIPLVRWWLSTKGKSRNPSFHNWFRKRVDLQKVTKDINGWLYIRKILRKKRLDGKWTSDIFRGAPGSANYKAGLYIQVMHKKFFGGALYTRYMHLSEANVSVGQIVQQGQKIGVSGNTAIIDSREHLHYGVRDGGTSKSRRVDPEVYTSGLTSRFAR